jgi:adenylosuccinate synthase
MSGTLQVVVGGQYGSEGKGAIVAHLTRTVDASVEPPPLVVRVGGPNAGHTVYDDRGQRWALRQVPAGVIEEDAMLAIGAGSEVDPEVLSAEIDELERNGHKVADRLIIDPQVTIVTDAYRRAGEQEVRRGSTGKGTGVARAARVRRRAQIARDFAWSGLRLGWTMDDVAERARQQLWAGGSVIVEGTQGFGLGLHSGFYPYTTSGDCTALDMLAAAQIPPWADYVNRMLIWVVMRTYPIRVANREGSSGPMLNELSWDELFTRTKGHVRPERTTVTQKIRRVAEWDDQLARAAIKANGGAGRVVLALTMFDYWFPEIADQTELGWLNAAGLEAKLGELESELGCRVGLVGTGPKTIIDRRGADGQIP